MSKVVVTKSLLDGLADAVSTKSGQEIPLTIAEMTNAVNDIPAITVDPLSVTANDTYTAPAGHAYSPVTVSVPAVTPNLEDVSVSYTPSESVQTQTVTAGQGYDGLDEVSIEVGAISSSYVGSGVARHDSSDLSVSGATITAPAGYYESQASASVSSMTLPSSPASSSSGTSKTTISRSSSTRYLNIPTGYNSTAQYYTISAVADGTAGTPTATKGTVSNHAIAVTPSVTNTTGYISGSTKTGTAVTVSASELVSGSQTITNNGTVDVTNLAEVVVSVSGGGGKAIQVNSDAASVHTNGYTSTGISLTVAKAGKYKVSWMAWRSSSTGTMGTRLRVNSTDGTAQQTWTNTYGQHIVLENQTYAANDVLTLYATSGNTSRYCWAGNLIIEEV